MIIDEILIKSEINDNLTNSPTTPPDSDMKDRKNTKTLLKKYI